MAEGQPYECRNCGAKDPYIFVWEKALVRRDIFGVQPDEGFDDEAILEPADWGDLDEIEAPDLGDEWQEWWCGECNTSKPTLGELVRLTFSTEDV